MSHLPSLRQILTLLLWMIAPSAVFAQTKNSTVAPIELRCESRTNPIGVDSSNPRLGWILKSTARGASQTAYQILAASSLQLLAKNRGDLWDSGKVNSEAFNEIAYAGKPLTSSQGVFWKVRVHDTAGTPSDWSAPAGWVMGALTPADWKDAKWIGAPSNSQPFDPKEAIKGPKEKYESVLLRRNLTIKPSLTRAVLHVTGLAQYELSLNGGKVGDALLTPGWTAYDKTVLYDTYDITRSLRPGANALGLFLGNGFYNTHNGR
ncbi:MAG: alpha-L-rhamnosidase N-terminal domain-containing protein, partial [Luteolibacter sp.]